MKMEKQQRDLLALEITAGPCKKTILTGTTSRVTIGRTKVNNFYIKDSAVSQRHAVLEWAAGGVWTVTDLGSSNGTALNGRPLAEGEAAELKNGDMLQLGLDTWARVETRPPLDDKCTVEMFLRQEADLLRARMLATCELYEKQMREQEAVTRQELLALAVAT